MSLLGFYADLSFQLADNLSKQTAQTLLVNKLIMDISLIK